MRNSKLEGRFHATGDELPYRSPLAWRSFWFVFPVWLIAGLPLTSINAQNPDDPKISAAVSPETRRARELIYQFRQYRVFSRDEEWARTLRELVEIGKPAVPELVAELDRTDRNSTIRSLGFTLRAIGDARGVPALIRAIPKTRGNQGSDCGVIIRDLELRAFMRKHQNHPQSDEDQSTLRGRPVNEIVTALEKLTMHPAPHPENGQDDRRERWLAWWEEHKNEYQIDDELRAVAQRKPEDDPVEQAGVAKFGPLFPTGPDWRLGPLREVTLGNEHYANAKAFLDFDSGRVFEFQEGWRRSEPATPSNYSGVYFQWIADQGIDVRNNGMLDGSNLNAWLIDDERWETLEDEMKTGDPLKLGRETTTYLEPFTNQPNEFKNDRLGTFLFTTRDGGRGILQVFPERGENFSRRLQYRLFQSVNQTPDELPNETRPEGKTRFSKTVTITLPLVKVDAECLLDLETEQTYSLPPQFEKSLSNLWQFFRDKESAEWCRNRGIDVIATSLKNANTFGDAERDRTRIQFGVFGCNLRAIRLLPKSFYHLSVEEVREILLRDSADPPSTALMRLESKSTDEVETYAIETRDGTIGLIKLEQVPDEADKILIRYRLHPMDAKSH